jgi:hypothetical protein
VIRRRHVFYVEAFDTHGVPGYHRLFRREYARFANVWSTTGRVGEPEIDGDGVAARWRVETAGPNWQVSTTYEMLRWDDIIAAGLAHAMWRRLPRAIASFADNVANGTVAHMFRVSRRFGLSYVFPFVFLLLMVAFTLLLGIMGAWFALNHTGSSIAGLVGGVALAAAGYAAASMLARKWHVVHLADGWMWGNDWGRGRKPEFTERLDVFARRIIARAQAADMDEILVVGHSLGATACLPLIARALEIAPGFARSVPHFSMLTLGNPFTTSHPQAKLFRAGVPRIVSEPSVTWIECQARKDAMNFYNFDPLWGVSLDPQQPRCNPILWLVRFDGALLPQFYRKLRWNFLRMHYQFVMANDLRAPYDYFMLVCGPVPASGWATRGRDMVAAFANDATFSTERLAPPLVEEKLR